jgi:hypothetical protein
MIKIVILLAVLFSILSFTSCKRRDGKKIEGTVIKVTNIGLDWHYVIYEEKTGREINWKTHVHQGHPNLPKYHLHQKVSIELLDEEISRGFSYWCYDNALIILVLFVLFFIVLACNGYYNGSYD